MENVHHKILPTAQSGTWRTSTVASAARGHYDINVSDGFVAKQKWQFKYNALATAKSTMSSVKLTLEWEYDLDDNNYKTFLK